MKFDWDVVVSISDKNDYIKIKTITRIIIQLIENLK